MRKAKPIAVTYQEAGRWKPFRRWQHSKPVHAILFADGSIWDSYNGWRRTKDRYDQKRIQEIKEVWAEGDE